MGYPNRRPSWLVIAGLVAMLASRGARAQEAVAASGEPKTLRELIDVSIKSYEVYPTADSKQPAEALTALRWREVAICLRAAHVGRAGGTARRHGGLEGGAVSHTARPAPAVFHAWHADPAGPRTQRG